MEFPSLKGQIAKVQNDLTRYCDFECQSHNCEDCPVNTALRRLDSIIAFPNWNIPIAELLDVSDEITATLETPHFRVMDGGKK